MPEPTKKIRRVSVPSKVKVDETKEKAAAEGQVTDAEFKRELLEVLKSIDWKLWESLKSTQRLEKALGAAEIVADVDQD